MSRMNWNAGIGENTKLHVKPDGPVVIIRTESSRTADLPPEYLVAAAETLNKAE